MALVYPNNDPLGFMCAFYGCIMAGIVPVPIEVPLTRRDAGSQQIGFLLGKFTNKKDCLFRFFNIKILIKATENEFDIHLAKVG